MGKCLVDMSISILIFYDGCCLELPVWSTCYLRLKLKKFPSPPWETHVLCSLFAGRRCLGLFWQSDLVIVHHHWQHGYCTCSRSKFPIAPMGKLLTCSPRLTLAHCGRRSGQLQVVRAAETFNVSHRPMGDSRLARCLQGGGGVHVAGGTVSISSCTISGNTAAKVRAHVQQFPLPRWEKR